LRLTSVTAPDDCAASRLVVKVSTRMSSTTPLAPDADLVALRELGRVGHDRGHVVGRDERQAVVRVVGEDDRDERDERRDRTDEDGVGERARTVLAPPAHLPFPSR
jgi:hypothetical protein